MAILGMILVGVVLAKSRHTHQRALAERQTAAVRAADELIAGWWTGPGVPIGESGTVGGDETMIWQTRLTPNDAMERLGARVVRVELCDAGARTDSAGGQREALVTVDLVLPVPSGKPDGRAQP